MEYKYKVAVIGLGNIGLMYDREKQRPHPSTHIYAYEMSDGFQLSCGIDPLQGKKQSLHDASSEATYYSSLEEALINGNMDDVDVVSVCTPPSTHLDIMIKLLNARVGKIIICEKPIVSSLDEVGKLQRALEKTNTIIVPNISRRWNVGLRKVGGVINSGELGELKKINIRYTRGIYNTGTHLFDLLKMWTHSSIKKVLTLGETLTSSYPEKTFDFWFEQDNGVTGYAEAINDKNYYQFDIDLYLTNGKIEMRNSGDDVKYYGTTQHHLFQGFKELTLLSEYKELLADSCIKNAIENIYNVLEGKEEPFCTIEDAIYALKVAKALEESYDKKRMVEL